MKKLVLTTVAVAATALVSHAQGTISLQGAKGTVQTNGVAFGEGSGNLMTAAGNYYFEVLDMTASQWAGLSSAQQSAAASLFSSGATNLWTDTGVSGVNQTSSLTAGGVIGEGTATGTSAANWAAPTGNVYSTAPNYDYYVVVGWSANEGTTWGAVSQELASGTWNTLGLNAWFGESAIAYNYAGGGPNTLNAVNVWGTSGATGLAGSGINSGNPELVLQVVPEPTTLALAGLGGLSMLFLRRRK